VVSYAITNQWQGGFQGDVTIRNTGAAAVSGWTLQWSFANGQLISAAWNATYSQSGATVQAGNAAWNATIAAGGTAAFGFTASWTNANATPTGFRLNGTTCATT
jgi:cellulase/cellobiase CelA1